MVLDASPYGFALELAVAASQREYLDLQQWLSDRFRQLALPFFQASPLTCSSDGHLVLADLGQLPSFPRRDRTAHHWMAERALPMFAK